MRERYRHTQVGWTLIVLVTAAVVAEITVVAVVAAGDVFALAVSGALAAVLAVVIVLFSTLTIVVDDAAVWLSFGLGSLRREVSLEEITAASRVRNSWWSGFGVRVIPRGRLYNVGGLDAVELELDNGRVVRLGTDEPAVLLAAVQAALDQRRQR